MRSSHRSRMYTILREPQSKAYTLVRRRSRLFVTVKQKLSAHVKGVSRWEATQVVENQVLDIMLGRRQ